MTMNNLLKISIQYPNLWTYMQVFVSDFLFLNVNFSKMLSQMKWILFFLKLMGFFVTLRAHLYCVVQHLMIVAWTSCHYCKIFAGIKRINKLWQVLTPSNFCATSCSCCASVARNHIWSINAPLCPCGPWLSTRGKIKALFHEPIVYWYECYIMRCCIFSGCSGTNSFTCCLSEWSQICKFFFRHSPCFHH